MNAREFFDLVSQMREKQKQYFSTRDKRVLAMSKSLENVVDAEIARVNMILSNNCSANNNNQQ